MLTMKDQIAKKSNKIEEIKSSLKQSQHILMKKTLTNLNNKGDDQQSILNNTDI